MKKSLTKSNLPSSLCSAAIDAALHACDKYAVYYKKQSDSKWAVVQDFSTNSTLKIKPAKAVKYDVCVKVKDSNKTIEKKYFVITVN